MEKKESLGKSDWVGLRAGRRLTAGVNPRWGLDRCLGCALRQEGTNGSQAACCRTPRSFNMTVKKEEARGKAACKREAFDRVGKVLQMDRKPIGDRTRKYPERKCYRKRKDGIKIM